MGTHRYSWLVQRADGSSIQVNADILRVTEAGDLAFSLNDGSGGSYVSLVLPSGAFKQAAIMSAVDGYQNAYHVLEAG